LQPYFIFSERRKRQGAGGQMNKKSVLISGLSSLCAIAFLAGCSRRLLLDPKGPIGDAERFVILASFGLMLIVVIPVFVMLFWFFVRYRASNAKTHYMPKWSRSNKIELTMGLVPAVIVANLAIISWTAAHRLDPFKPIDAAAKPVSIEAVSMDWKWLFIYPGYLSGVHCGS
jgi:cytochrome o ubiquinol oxidase subunit 2